MSILKGMKAFKVAGDDGSIIAAVAVSSPRGPVVKVYILPGRFSGGNFYITKYNPWHSETSWGHLLDSLDEENPGWEVFNGSLINDTGWDLGEMPYMDDDHWYEVCMQAA